MSSRREAIAKPVLVVQHVPWEGPHRIARALERADLNIDGRSPLRGDSLPPQSEVSAAVFMGGPMNVDQTNRYPALAAEREWLTDAIERDLPVLGVCLGAQLIARALGVDVRPGAQPEIGWSDIAVLDESDPVIGKLAPDAQALHWHGDVFELPVEAKHLASSSATEIQAFRARNAWALLFHAEADADLVDAWLSEPTMAAEARAALGEDFEQSLREGARVAQTRGLIAKSNAAFDAFAEFIRLR
ncbi:MAG: type 1 glutamine amidotransferase [Solirubrobacterales bacterium]